MDACVPAVYNPRRPRDSPLYRFLEDQFETLLQIHEERYQSRYGRLRHAARRAVEKFLDCGILEQGLARVRCNRCKVEFLVAFSCKAPIRCPSCHAKKLEISVFTSSMGMVSVLRVRGAVRPAGRREG